MLNPNVLGRYSTFDAPPFGPSEPAIENPLASRCVFLYTARDTRLEAVNRRGVTNVGVTRAVGPSGLGLVFSGSAGVNLSWGAISSLNNLHNVPATWAFRMRLTSTASHTGVMQMSDAIVDRGWNIGSITGGFGLKLVRSGLPALISTSLVNIPTGRDFSLVIVSPGTIAAAGQIYIDGSPVATTIINGAGTTGPMTNQTVFLGSCQLGGDLAGTIYLASAFTRLWTNVDVQDFQRNPWQMIRKTRVPLKAYVSNPSANNAALFFGAGSQ